MSPPRMGNAAPDAISATPVSREEQMEIYDSLPPRWRLLVGALPSPQELATLREYLLRFGEAEGWELVASAFEEKYPGWKRPQE